MCYMCQFGSYMQDSTSYCIRTDIHLLKELIISLTMITEHVSLIGQSFIVSIVCECIHLEEKEAFILFLSMCLERKISMYSAYF